MFSAATWAMPPLMLITTLICQVNRNVLHTLCFESNTHHAWAPEPLTAAAILQVALTID
jgi:hypothetical protein